MLFLRVEEAVRQAPVYATHAAPSRATAAGARYTTAGAHMSHELLLATGADGRQIRFVLDVFEEQGHWTSTLARLDAHGQPEAAVVAPRFYGFTLAQARRRMLDVLENQFDSVQVVSGS
jgi:hypothetical protein